MSVLQQEVEKRCGSSSKTEVCCYDCMFLYQEKLSNLNISVGQNWTSPIVTLQEKENNEALHVTVGWKIMKLWPMKVCQNPGSNHNVNAQMELFVISIFHIFKWLFPITTKKSHFTHFLMFFLTLLSILSSYATKISRFLSLQRNT